MGPEQTSTQEKAPPSAEELATPATPDRHARVSELSQKARSGPALRAALAADPQLARAIEQYFAEGNDDQALNALLASTFTGSRAKAPAETPATPGAPAVAKEKGPTDPTQALPGARTGDKKLAKGQMKWTLSATSHDDAHVDVDFLPDKDKVDAKNVSFIQTVLNKVGPDLAYAGGTPEDPAINKDKYEKFEEPTSKKRVDHMPDDENDPFYGAEWDQTDLKWVSEGGTWQVGNSVKGVSSAHASMTDGPGVDWAREGKGDTETTFEVVPTVLETREPLGSLQWGFKIKDEANAPIELLFGEDADCVDAPTADWAKTIDAYYAGKYETILDDFDIAKSDLKADHKTKLDDVATKMAGNEALYVQLGGACDHTGDEAFNQALSLKRAETARDYLVGKGIDEGRIEVQSYSFDWARVEAEKGKSEGKNRRVQVLLQ